MNNTEISAGMLVLSNGYRVHIARSAEKTVCGKEINRTYPDQTSKADCKVCRKR